MRRAARGSPRGAAHAGGAVIRRALDEHGGARRVEFKGPIDLVTEVDLASESAIRELLARRSPGVPVLAEESGGEAHQGTRWLVDPLDGTTNFAHGFTAFAVSVGLQQDGQIVAGCIYDPVADVTYCAARGGGAFADEARLRVSQTSALSGALLLTGFPYDRRERAAFYLAPFTAFLLRAQGIRRCGAAALDFVRVATGQADGFWEFGLSPWDVAAGALLVEEAGGRVTDMAGGALDIDRPRVLASNGRVHREMADVLAPLLGQDR